ncbi:major capsid protein [Microbulbifer sp. PSTR4-B]|uniref:major capsid protein n=1 Tax=unclassified Microbulbifer TaxID=2619833 RepID=UPI00403AE6D8
MPMEMGNPFARPEFNMASLTEAIKLLPNMYDRTGKLNLFKEKKITSRTALIEYKNGRFYLIKSQQLGAPGQSHKTGKRNIKSFLVPHYPLEGEILPEQYANIRAFGSTSSLASLAEVMNDTLQDLKDSHDITQENARMGAIKGVITDADGSTIYNLYNEFNITKKVITFNHNDDFRIKTLELKRHIEDNIYGDAMDGVRVEVSQEFMDFFVTHDSVEKPYLHHAEASQRLGGDPRKSFEFQGVIFSEYRGKAMDSQGNTQRFIGAGSGHAYPTGTHRTFQEIIAPADFLETVSTLGERYYVKSEARKFNRGVDVHTQSNVLAMCNNPSVLAEVKKGSTG